MKRVLIFICALLILGLCFITEAEQEAYTGVTSSAYGEAVPAPIGYRPVEKRDGKDMGAGAFSSPQDLFFDSSSGELYVADTGNARLVVLDRNLDFIREYTSAGDVPFVSPTGVFVSKKGEILIADEGVQGVLCMDREGEMLRRYDRPVSDLYGKDTPYRPQKVVADSAGRVYVLSAGVYQGLLCFYEDGSFLNFFGASHVNVTAKLLLQKMWRSVMTREQREATESFVPIEYANITIDDEDMIYAVLAVSETVDSPAVVKLNPMGINILPNYQIGGTGLALADVLGERDGLMTVLDKGSRLVMEYGEHTAGILLQFGGFGSQLGLFKTPVSMEEMDGDILILDSETGAVTRFIKTAFGSAIHEATAQYAQGLYTESIALWERVLRMNNNFAMAHRGLGRAYFQLEEYENAMDSYRLANDKQGYSAAFKEQSLIWIRAHIGWIFGGLAATFALLQGRKYLLRWIWRDGALQKEKSQCFALRAMLHPYAAFDEVKSDGMGSVRVGMLLVLLFFLTSVISYVGTGFIFNPRRLERLNVLRQLAVTLGSVMLVYGSNLAVSSLMDDCEGRPGELFIVLSHALLPLILTKLFATLISNFVSSEIGVFLSMLKTLGVIWALVMYLTGQYQVNRLSFKRAIINMLLTVIALTIILVLIVLLYSLLQQIILFAVTLYHEIMFRI